MEQAIGGLIMGLLAALSLVVAYSGSKQAEDLKRENDYLHNHLGLVQKDADSNRASVFSLPKEMRYFSLNEKNEVIPGRDGKKLEQLNLSLQVQLNDGKWIDRSVVWQGETYRIVTVFSPKK